MPERSDTCSLHGRRGAAEKTSFAFLVPPSPCELLLVRSLSVFLEIISMGRCGDREIKKMQASMTDQKSAFATVLAIQSMLMQRFEEQIPDSNLTKRFAANPNSPGRSGSDWRCSDLLGAQ